MFYGYIVINNTQDLVRNVSSGGYTFMVHRNGNSNNTEKILQGNKPDVTKALHKTTFIPKIKG